MGAGHSISSDAVRAAATAIHQAFSRGAEGDCEDHSEDHSEDYSEASSEDSSEDHVDGNCRCDGRGGVAPDLDDAHTEQRPDPAVPVVFVPAQTGTALVQMIRAAAE